MSSYHHLADRVLNRPLIVTESRLLTVLDAIGDRLQIIAPEGARAAAAPAPRKKADKSGSTAVIPIHGTLVHRGGYMDAESGLVSYSLIREMFDDAMSDPHITSIVFDIDSPGGEVAGGFDLADHIFESRGKKPLTALVNESCFSGAYLLASACDRIHMPRTGGVGSIGVVIAHVDRSKADAMAGKVVTHIFSGARKVDMNSHSPLSAEARKTAQDLCSDIYGLMCSTVARNRGMSVEAIRATEAGVYFGRKAIAAGLADVLVGGIAISSSTGTATGTGISAETPADPWGEIYNRVYGAKVPAPARTFEQIHADVFGGKP